MHTEVNIMIKLGIISAATYGATYQGENVPRTPGSFHGTAFASTYNGFDAVKAKHLFSSLSVGVYINVIHGRYPLEVVQLFG